MSYDPDQVTNATNKAILKALSICEEHKNIELTPLHLAAALFSDSRSFAVRVASRQNIESHAVQDTLNSALSRQPSQTPPPSNPSFNNSFRNVLRTAEKYSQKDKSPNLASDHLLQAQYEDDATSRSLQASGLPKLKVEETIKQIKGKNTHPKDSKNVEDTYGVLEKYGRNIVRDAEDGKQDPVIGRDAEIRRVIQVLSRRTKNNPVLIGEPGVGKTAIIEGLAQRIVRGDVPSPLKNRHQISQDVGALVAGASHRGEFEERLMAVLQEVKDAEGGIILFIDEFHLQIGAGQTTGALDASNMLKAGLARGELRCIGATTLDEYRKYIEKDAAFERRLQQVLVLEPTVNDTISILRGQKERYETHHGVRIKDSALIVAAQLAKRYITNRFLPDKAIDLIDEACASTRVQLDSQPVIIDEQERRKLQLEVEVTALSKENDDSSKRRLRECNEEIYEIDTQLKPLREQYTKEQSRVKEIMSLKIKLEDLQNKADKATREKDVTRAADLRYYAIPEVQSRINVQEHEIELEKEKEKNEQDVNRLVSEVVGPDAVAAIASRTTGIPISKLNQTDRDRLVNLSKHLHKHVIGQDSAVNSVANAVLRTRAGLGRIDQPMGSFLFLGPTGVGKTQLAKALAYELFDDEKHMVRIDMSEYSQEHNISRLIGAPPGYVGYDQGGTLTEAIRRQPYSVVLFDEVEKAHPSIWNVLQQVFDDGRLTDGLGHIVNFTNTVIIMTSNLGANYLLDSISKHGTFTYEDEIKKKIMLEVRKYFRPELLNRLDDIIIFTPLTQKIIEKIIQQQIDVINKRMDDRNIHINQKPEVIQYISNQAYDPIFGARPIKRWLERHLVTKLSKLLIGDHLQNNTLVTVSLSKDFINTTKSKSGVDFTEESDDNDDDNIQFTFVPLEVKNISSKSRLRQYMNHTDADGNYNNIKNNTMIDDYENMSEKAIQDLTIPQKYIQIIDEILVSNLKKEEAEQNTQQNWQESIDIAQQTIENVKNNLIENHVGYMPIPMNEEQIKRTIQIAKNRTKKLSIKMDDNDDNTSYQIIPAQSSSISLFTNNQLEILEHISEKFLSSLLSLPILYIPPKMTVSNEQIPSKKRQICNDNTVQIQYNQVTANNITVKPQTDIANCLLETLLDSFSSLSLIPSNTTDDTISTDNTIAFYQQFENVQKQITTAEITELQLRSQYENNAKIALQNWNIKLQK